MYFSAVDKYIVGSGKVPGKINLDCGIIWISGTYWYSPLSLMGLSNVTMIMNALFNWTNVKSSRTIRAYPCHMEDCIKVKDMSAAEESAFEINFIAVLPDMWLLETAAGCPDKFPEWTAKLCVYLILSFMWC